LLTLLSFV